MDLGRMTAAGLGRDYDSGTADPVEVTEAHLAALAAHPATARIYARLSPERARAEAVAARDRARAGTRRGPLDGVPVSWKDLFDTAGTGTEGGTAMLSGRVPGTDAAVVAEGARGGLVCLGKTHLSEIAFAGLGYNPVTATPPNVNDPEAVPGGSSSGAAASAAFGLAVAGIGSDTGGSVRLPAAWNDLIGFKPAHGLLPLEGALPLCTGFDTVGPLCRSVEDAGLLVQTLSGGRWRAPDLGGASLAGLRLLVVESVVTEELDPAPAAAWEHSLSRLSAAGAGIVRARFPDLAGAYDVAGPVYAAEAWAAWRDLIGQKGALMFHQVRQRIGVGETVTAADYIAGWEHLRHLRRGFAALMAGHDAVICPTSPILPPKVQAVATDDAFYRSANLRALRNTRMGNLMGLAGISLPTGHPSCGLMLQVQPGAEGHLLRIAEAAARALT